MRIPTLSISMLSLLLVGAATPSGVELSRTARYRVTFERTWSSDTHPQDFPLLVSLVENGEFVASRTALEARDVGTDSATSYRALDADMQPRGPVQPNPSPYFQKDDTHNVVGRATFTRIP